MFIRFAQYGTKSLGVCDMNMVPMRAVKSTGLQPVFKQLEVFRDWEKVFHKKLINLKIRHMTNAHLRAKSYCSLNP